MKVYDSEGTTDLPNVSTFKYLGTMIEQYGRQKMWKRSGKEDQRRHEIYGELTGVLCDRKIPTKLKFLLFKTAIKPTLMYGCEVWTLTQSQENRICAIEMRVLRQLLKRKLERQCNK